jgi:hypothetical protein
MPHNPINYANTIMYKIICNDINITDCYIGHTTNFKTRKNSHKSKCNNINSKAFNLIVYQFIRDNGGWDNWSMIMIEEYNCNNKLEATKRERELIEELKATLNKVIPSRTSKEYYEDNKDIIKEYHKEYYEDNKNIIKEKEKKYRESNKDIIKERKKEYYEDNKDKINEKHKKKFNCECGSYFRVSDKSTHFKSKKHQNYLKVSIPKQNASEIVC